MRRTKSLYFELELNEETEFNCRLSKSKSLENIHLSVNLSWFLKHKLTRSTSLDNLNLNEQNVDDRINRPFNNQPANHLTNQQMNNSKLMISKFIDDHNLPTSISDDFFNILMRYEKNRVRTFLNWPTQFVSPTDLSKAGFYYLLHKDFVRCFECKITLFNWESGDLAILEHYKNNPRCKLLCGYNVGNIAIDKTPLEILREYIDLDEFKPVQATEIIFESNEMNLDEEISPDFLNPLRFSRELINNCSFDQNQSDTATTNSDSENEEILFELMRCEDKRLETFETWPEDLADNVKPVDLAQCGFFFTAIRDKVICAFCKTPAWDWASTDVPIKEHYKHNPECPLLNDRECGNIANKNIRFKDLLMQFQDLPPSYLNAYSNNDIPFLHIHRSSGLTSDQSGRILNQILLRQMSADDRITDFKALKNKLKNFENYSQYILTHKHVDEFNQFRDRLKTYEKWSSKSKVNKNRLAEAGFYYLGIDDRVKCISCDLILSNWCNNDDPWVEHCKFSSNCEYLQLKKGIDFVRRNSNLKNSPKIEVVPTSSTASSVSSNSSSDIENEGSANSDEDAKTICNTCMTKEADVVFLPCRHLTSCASCTIAMKDCPICKKKINSTMKIYIS